jgi:predicted RNA binding protein YcfA (HicA-like mRNA interferase family)
MQGKELRKYIENALLKLGYDVTYESMDEGKGGFYRLRDKRAVVVDSKLAEDEKTGILLEILRDMDTSTLYLPPAVRRMLGQDDAKDDWE